jgi:hypothetical protein
VNLPVELLKRRLTARTLLVVLALLAVVAAVLTPDVKEQGGGFSSYSTAPGGTSIAFELAQRMGWRATRRETELDPSAPPSVQVVVAPSALGRHEVHRLLDNVRRGGGLLFSIGDNTELADSLGLALRIRGSLLMDMNNDCVRRPTAFGLATLPPSVYALVWRRPPPGEPVPLARVRDVRGMTAVAIGFPLGRGRVAVAGGDEPFANEAVRACQWSADVLVARMFEYLDTGAPMSLVFDEYHHGRGVHDGSMSAVVAYLSRTGSGRFFATLLVAGALLLFALSPRPVIPREPERIPRRSPLEHADALGRAYSDVAATRTATARLVSGLRRRVSRMVPTGRVADDGAFLEALGRRYPAIKPQVGLLERGLRDQISPREFALSADAIEDIERAVLTSPSVRA